MFLTTTSHELRTPLTAVQGYLELVTQYGEDFSPHERQEFLQKAQHCCDELIVVLGHIAEASDIEAHMGKLSVHLEPVSVQEMIHSVMNLIEPRLRQEQRAFYLDIPASFCVQADPARLRQVLLNLSVNALKYSPLGTPIAFFAHALTDRIVISVADKGQGIPPQDHVHLFQRFVRLERDINSPVRGSGLGLYISRCLIEAMGGKIGVESRGIEGEGSTFYIQLPRL